MSHSFSSIPTSESKAAALSDVCPDEFCSSLIDSPSGWRQRSRSHGYSTTCIVLLAVVLSTLLSTTTTLVSTSLRNGNEQRVHQSGQAVPFQQTPRLRHCGTTAAEARRLGCKFQIWSYSWVPPECYDGELVEEWLQLRDWEYYDVRYKHGKVVNFTTEVLVGEGDRKLYSTWGQHYWHCAFTWRKFLRSALGSGFGITDKDLEYDHANCCQETIRNKPDFRPWDENDIELQVDFHKC